MAVRRRWANRVLSGVGVRVRVQGEPPAMPCLLLANHRSYLDPIIILQHVDAFPVAKAELADWPLLGKGAEWAGILYVQRHRNESRVSTIKAIADTIQHRGISIILFPEGTTSDLPGMLPFKKGALRTAARWNLPVAPVALNYSKPAHFWVGEIGFLKHAWQVFQEKSIPAELCYGPVFQSSDSVELERQVRQWIESRLLHLHPAPISLQL
ncbi:MAG: 1-acyl-sn-glycerol-3-phosphate acyltransferase [Saprospiraceae bacterium]|nr:1-acyl-sn-glycerol-3-phosphate acyltransferase [Saprospiraceae bacterium]